MLNFYLRQFPTVEINSTYYRIPHPRVFENLAKKAPAGFDFMVKVPQSFTHRRIELKQEADQFQQALFPLVQSGKLSGLLAQYPYSFKFSDGGLDYLRFCRDITSPLPLYVEFRHNSWLNRKMYDCMRAEQIGYVSVDEPQLPGLLKPDCFVTTRTAYIRLHGRNGAHWWQGGALRYDYDYSEFELEYWKEKVKGILHKVDSVYVYFNNCHLGQAAKNARQFMNMFGIDWKSPDGGATGDLAI